MNPQAIFLPACAQGILTFLVQIYLFSSRSSAMRTKRVGIQEIAVDSKFDEVFRDCTDVSDNFENLFEVPVLFFALCGMLFMTGKVDLIYVSAAWAFVVFRALHSLVHCTSNQVNHRFLAYLFSCIALWGMWFRLSAQLIF
jgi:hypothetical protein